MVMGLDEAEDMNLIYFCSVILDITEIKNDIEERVSWM